MFKPNGAPSSGNISNAASVPEKNTTEEARKRQYEEALAKSRELDQEIIELRQRLKELKSQQRTHSDSRPNDTSNTPHSPSLSDSFKSTSASSAPSNSARPESASTRPNRSPDKAKQNPAFVKYLGTALSALMIGGIAVGVAVSSQAPNTSDKTSVPDTPPQVESSAESVSNNNSLSTTFGELGLDLILSPAGITETTTETTSTITPEDPVTSEVPEGPSEEPITYEVSEAPEDSKANPEVTNVFEAFESSDVIDAPANPDTIDTPDATYTGEYMSVEPTIFEGYDRYGMWLSPNKIDYLTGEKNEYALAAAQEVAEFCNYDEREMLKYAAFNQDKSVADYIYGLPSGLKSDFDFLKDIDRQTAESYVESLNSDEQKQLLDWFNYLLDQAYTRPIVLNGDCADAIAVPKDPNAPIDSANMELTDHISHKQGVIATEFYWPSSDGNEIGSMIVDIAHDEAGNIVGGNLQVLEPIDRPMDAESYANPEGS